MLRDERDIRRSDVMKDRRQALKKMQSIHGWQNWLDEKRCKTYRESDTREYRARRDRWNMGKAKPPLFGTMDMTHYDVEESRDWREALEDRRKLNEPLEMKPIERSGATVSPEKTPAPTPKLPNGSSKNALPFVRRDPKVHAEQVAERAKQRALERGGQERSRRGGRKRKPRPR